MFQDQTILHPEAKAKRDAIKVSGGAEYEALLERERSQKARHRSENGRQPYDQRVGRPFKTALCAQARQRGRSKGLEATITADDLVWPTHCPVLGIELNYADRSGQRGSGPTQQNWPSLDRWDNTKGYVPGNVFVISVRANVLKGNATADEMERIAAYMRERPR